MYSYGSLHNPVQSPPDTYQFPAHILNAQNNLVHPTSSQQSVQYSNDMFRFPHHQPSDFEKFQSFMNSAANLGYQTSVSSTVNPYPLPPLTTGGKSVTSSNTSQSSVGNSVTSSVNTTASVSVSTNNQLSNLDSKVEIFIENPVLTFIRSQMFR